MPSFKQKAGSRTDLVFTWNSWWEVSLDMTPPVAGLDLSSLAADSEIMRSIL